MILLLIFALLVAIATSRNADFSFFSFASPPASFFFFSVTGLICSFLFLIAWILSSLCFLGLFCMLLRW